MLSYFAFSSGITFFFLLHCSIFRPLTMRKAERGNAYEGAVDQVRVALHRLGLVNWDPVMQSPCLNKTLEFELLPFVFVQRPIR